MNSLNIRKNFYKLIFLLFLVLVLFGAFNISETEPYQLDSRESLENWVYFYHNLQCEYSLFEVINSYNLSFEISIRNEPSGSVECSGKNYWVDYQREQKIEDGWEKYSPIKLIIRIATNTHVDLVVQSLIWLTFLSFIPKNNNFSTKLNKVPIFLGVVLFSLHLIGEGGYYSTIGRDYYPWPFYRDYDNSLVFDNYYLYSFLLILLYLFFFIHKLLETRITNLINYFPFMFLVYGSFTSLNINFFVLVFSFIGIIGLFNNKISIKLTIIYLLFFVVWFLNSENLDKNFDVDKIKGFANTSQTNISLLFWGVVFYLLLIGVTYLVDLSKETFDLNLLSNNFLIASSLIVFTGLAGAINLPVNFLSFYILGHNKTGMNTLQSVDGNAWRGLYPSAESIGEFFAFVILFCLVTYFINEFKFKIYHFFLLVINFYGLYRANNASAIISLLVLILFILIYKNIQSKKTRNLIYFLLIILLILGYLFLISNNSFQLLSGSVMFEAVKASSINYDFQLNEYNQSAVDNANYALLLSLPADKTNFSSSLTYLLNSYTFGNRIDNVPSAISLVSSVSYYINRSEKWGIFIAKYNPNLSEFLFGYGPNQLTEYYLGHETKYQEGLVLPHSSLITYFIFFGIIGLLVILFLIFVYVWKNKNDFYGNVLMLFFLINFLKSDSLLYIPNFLMFLILINLLRIKNIFVEEA